MIAFALTAAEPTDDYERRCREQIAELRRDAGLCERCGEEPHAWRCRFALGYYDRKQVGLCTYKGCDQPCSEMSVQCEGHAADAVDRQREHRERMGRHARGEL